MSPLIIAEIVVSLGIFSTVATSLKLTTANPFTIGIIRLAIATLGLLMIVFYKNSLRDFFKHSRENFKDLCLIGVLFFVHWLTYFFSIKLATASIGILSLSTYGVFMGLTGSFFHDEPFHLKDILACAICFCGVYFLIPELSFENTNTLGLLIGLVSALVYSLVPTAHKRINHVPQSIRTFYQFLGALILFLFLAPFANWDLKAIDWWILIYLGVMATLVAHSLWSKVSANMPSKTSGLIYYIYIPISVTIAVIYMGDPISTNFIIGAALIFVGLLMGLFGLQIRSLKLH